MSSWYYDAILKQAEVTEGKELQAAMSLARYVNSRRSIRSTIIVECLDRVHHSWRDLDTWFHFTKDLDTSDLGLSLAHLNEVVGITKDFAEKCSQIDDQKSLIVDHLWSIVTFTSDVERLIEVSQKVESRFQAHTVWQLMAVRLAVKRALVLLEFDADDDVQTVRF